MDAIFDLFSRYWTFILIALSFLVSIYSKRPKKANGGSKMPPFGNSGSGGKPLFDSEPTRLARDEHPTAPHIGGRMDEPAPSAVRPMVETLHHTPSGVMPIRAAEYGNSAADIARSSLKNGPGKRALIQGVLWAEILGPPRSKKPRIR